jgi:hemolysin III
VFHGGEQGAALSGMRRALPAVHGPERTADIGVLAFGLIAGVCGAIVLLVVTFDHNPHRLVGVFLYSAALLAMLVFSLLYRSAIEPARRQFLRRLDHAAIFAMIAGSATPFALAGGTRGMLALTALWAVAALGIAFKLYFPILSIRRSVAFYLVLGWAALFAVGPAISGDTALLIATGGAFYSAGVAFLLRWRLPYRLAVWHMFMLAGAACHYAAIFAAVALA